MSAPRSLAVSRTLRRPPSVMPQTVLGASQTRSRPYLVEQVATCAESVPPGSDRPGRLRPPEAGPATHGASTTFPPTSSKARKISLVGRRARDVVHEVKGGGAAASGPPPARQCRRPGSTTRHRATASSGASVASDPGDEPHVVADAFEQRLPEMVVGIDEAGKDERFGRVDPSSGCHLFGDPIGRADCDDAVAFDGDGAGAVDRIRWVDRNDAGGRHEQIGVQWHDAPLPRASKAQRYRAGRVRCVAVSMLTPYLRSAGECAPSIVEIAALTVPQACGLGAVQICRWL